MSIHHLVKEEDFLEQCSYCGREINGRKWKTELLVEKHYKKIKCECGAELRFRVGFAGSGHDEFTR